MKYISKFNNDSERNNYMKYNFVSPHVFMNTQNRNVNYFPKYKRLTYINSTETGGQYVDLGCKLMENTDDIQIYIKFNIKGDGKDNNYQSTLIASQPEVNPYPGFILRKTGNNTSYYNYKFIDFSTKWSFENSIKGNNTNKYYANALRGPFNGETFDDTNTIHK